MKLVCRKCLIEFPLSDFDMALPINTQIDDIQRLTCGAGGTHRVVGTR